MTLNQPLQPLKRLFPMGQICKAFCLIIITFGMIAAPRLVFAMPQIEAVKMEKLDELSINTLGLKQILPGTIWIHSNPKKVSDLIEKTSKLPLSPAMRDKVLALMTTDTGGVYWENNPYAPDRFLMTRLNALLELGAFTQVVDLINQIPQSKLAPKFIRLKAMALVLAGRTKEACTLVDAPALARQSDEMRLTCLMEDGDMTKAKLAFAVYKEDGGTDKTLIALANRVFEETKDKLPPIKVYTPWHVAFLAALGDKMPDVSDQPLWLKKALSTRKNVPIAKRIEFAEHTGVSWRDLDILYTSVFPGTPAANSSIKRALLYQKMKTAPTPEEQAKAANDFLNAARDDKLFLALAPMAEEVLCTLKPSAENAYLAFNAVQVFALTDNLSMGHPWYELLRNSPDKNRQFEAFLLSPVMNKMGAGLPGYIDEALEKCLKDSSPYCPQFVQMIPDYFPIENTDLLLTLSDKVKSSSAPFKQMALGKMIKDGKTAEAMLWAIAELSTSQNYEKGILQALSAILPQYLSRSIIIEQMVYE